MKKMIAIASCVLVSISLQLKGQTNVTEIAFRNADGGDDTDPYRMRKVQSSTNYNWLELQLNDDADESFRIYGNSCVGFGCALYSNNLYHLFNTSGTAFHAGNLGIGINNPATRIHLSDGTPSSVQALNSLTKLTVDAPTGGFSEFRTSMDNNAFAGLLFTDNNLGGYVVYRNSPDDKLHIGGYSGISFEVGGSNNVGEKPERVRIDANGNVGIGTSSPTQKLTVNGTIYGKEVKVDLNVPGPDYVFAKDYLLPSLDSVATYIEENKHLPEVPSAKEMETKGINLSEMNMLLLKKVEELTLYIIEQEKRIKALEQKR